MSSAAARAEARRKAILSRGSDRLAKLTTSARGEDTPVFMHDDKPSAIPSNVSNMRQFVGEEAALPTPPSISRNVSNSRPSPQPAGSEALNPEQLLSALLGASNSSNPEAAEQQRQLLSALMGGAGSLPESTQSRRPTSTSEARQNEDPFAQLLALSQSQGEQGDVGMPPAFDMPNLFPPPSAPLAQKTLLQRVLPLVHAAAAWLLLAYFVLWKESEVYNDRVHGVIGSESRWSRWAELSRRKPDETWGVQFVPFFWAFTTLTLVLHSWRIFQGLDPIRLPMMVSMAVAQLPRSFSALIMNVLKYLQIGRVFLDDIAVLLFGLGLLIWFASWFAD